MKVNNEALSRNYQADNRSYLNIYIWNLKERSGFDEICILRSLLFFMQSMV